MNVMCLLSNVNITITVLKGSKVDHIKLSIMYMEGGNARCLITIDS